LALAVTFTILVPSVARHNPLHRTPRSAGEQESTTTFLTSRTQLFPSVNLPLRFRRFSLADLRLVLSITKKPLATTPPPPSVLHAGIFASRGSGQAVAEFLSSARECFSNR